VSQPASKTAEQLIKAQLEKWKQRSARDASTPSTRISVITLSMQPGSGGSLVAESLAQRLDFDYFHRKIIKEIASSAKTSAAVVESVEKERLSGIGDFIALLVKKHYLYPDDYLMHLMQVINTIAEHGRAVIVGRGANFILPPEKRFSIRVIADMDLRIRNVASAFSCSRDEARRRIVQRESRRSAFIRQFFHADIDDPLCYDMVLNTGTTDIHSAVEAILGAVSYSLQQK
jgi:cytidylate kinase